MESGSNVYKALLVNIRISSAFKYNFDFAKYLQNSDFLIKKERFNNISFIVELAITKQESNKPVKILSKFCGLFKSKAIGIIK